MTEPPPDRVRLDVWLWRARFFKTRKLAADAVGGRGVRIDRNGDVRRVDKPAANVMAGDVLTFSKQSLIHVIEVVELGERRGPAAEAATLYKRLEGGA